MTLKSPLRSIQAFRRRHDVLYGGAVETYDQKVLATGPIAYWPQSETAGVTAHCLVNPLQDGTYTGVTLADDNTGPFGTPAPFYDGVNDYLDVLTAALQAAWSGTEGTVLAWARVNAIGTWTDGITRRIANMEVSGANRVYLLKNALNDTLSYRHVGGGVSNLADQNPINSTAWMLIGLTWSVVDNQVIRYYNGAQEGAIMGPIGAWVGVPTRMLFGAATIAPNDLWLGWQGPCAIWNRALPPATIASLYV